MGCWPHILPSLPRAPSVSDLLPQPKPKAIERVMRFLASCWVWSRPRASPHPTQPGVHGCRDGLASLRPPLLSAAGTEFCAHSLTSAGRKQETGLMGQPSHQSVCPQGRQHPDCVTFAGGAGVGVVTSVMSDSVTMDCSPPGFSVHGILQARMLEWVAMPSSATSMHNSNNDDNGCFAWSLHCGPGTVLGTLQTLHLILTLRGAMTLLT